ncbi:hypothetical protein HA402_015889 [Bradysia odoriphaga]|nr:hypothetical protein HA402_015889 [Bradysia odoriphaga]
MFNAAFGNAYVDGGNGEQLSDNESIVSTQQLKAIRISGLTVERSESSWSLNDATVPELLEKSKATLRLFGDGLTKDTTITFAQLACQDAINQVEFAVVDYFEYSAVVEIIVPDASELYYHICAKNANSSLVEQGNKNWVVIKSVPAAMPMWLTCTIIAVCLAFSALFSGLNLGLMALDKTEIKILINTGNANERKYAKIIQPVRNHGNFLLCSILLGNVLVNSTNAAVMGGLMSGPFAVAISTILIVIFGEVSPQAICSRFGLPVGANTIWITYVLMVITFPVAYPISKFLDWILGEEIGKSYGRERLKELVRLTTDDIDLDKDEVNIISGALDMKKKTVAEAMTPIDDVFMLSYDAVLDFETISEIMKSGYSRIPVYDGQRHNVQKLLLIKDLALIDPDDNTPLRTLCEFYQNYCYFVFEDATLAAVFRQFKTGQHGHMAFVRRIRNEEDPNTATVETIGLITLEDVIEELIQAEIMDETDITSSLQLKSKNKALERFEPFASFGERQRIHLTPQLASASFQYLSTCVEAFKPECISPTILQRLLKQDVIFQIKCKGKDKHDDSLIIFEQGKPVDYFVLILEGHVEVTVGIENLTFECGPFTFFGSDALAQNIGSVESRKSIRGSIKSLNLNAKLKHSFEPDYTVKAIKDVMYIAIKRSLYLVAVRATLMERLQKVDDHGNNEEQIDDDVKIFLNSLHDDYKAIRAADVANTLKTYVSAKSSSPNEVAVPVENVGARYEPENETVQMMLPPHI